MQSIWLIPVVVLLGAAPAPAAPAQTPAAQAPAAPAQAPAAQAQAPARAPARAAVEPWVPDLATVLAVENRVVLPPGSAPRDRYLRVYAGEDHGGRHLLRGRYFLNKDPKNPPIRMVMTAQVFPPPNAPGCGVIDVVFDVTESRQVSAVCIGR